MIKDLIGRKFGRLLVIKISNNINSRIRWDCICECGNYKTIDSAHLLSGHTKSCGCLYLENIKTINLKHGQSIGDSTSEYMTWKAMKGRCYDPNNNAYHNYGGRGIKVCRRWLNSFDNFYRDMGKKPTIAHTLDRHPNINGDYKPSNCRWATAKEQGRGRRNNKWLVYNGKKMILQDWANYLGIDRMSISIRLKKGESFHSIVKYYLIKQSKRKNIKSLS